MSCSFLSSIVVGVWNTDSLSASDIFTPLILFLHFKMTVFLEKGKGFSVFVNGFSPQFEILLGQFQCSFSRSELVLFCFRAVLFCIMSLKLGEQ